MIKNNGNYPHETAIEYFGARISFSTLIRQIDTTAKALKEYHVERGDFVTICATTTPEVIYLFYAISKIGAVANVISPFYTPEFEKTKGKTIVVLPMMNSSPLRFLPRRYKKPHLVNHVMWNRFIKAGSYRTDVAVDAYEPLKPQAMVYSSGTTGASKGILLSVDSFQKLINAYGNSGFDTSRRQTVYQNIPPWHSTGLSLGIHFPLSYGVKLAL